MKIIAQNMLLRGLTRCVISFCGLYQFVGSPRKARALNSNNTKPHEHPRLQLALDGTLEQAVTVLDLVAPYVDIVELGTPLLYREGIRAAAHIHHLYPDMTLLADMKIMDAGEEEA